MVLVTLVVAETLFVKHYIEGAQDAAASGSGSPASTDEMDAPSAAHLAMERLDTAVTVCCAVVWVIPHLLLFLLPRSLVSACMQSNWESQLEFVNNLMNNSVEKPSGACARCAAHNERSWPPYGPVYAEPVPIHDAPVPARSRSTVVPESAATT